MAQVQKAHPTMTWPLASVSPLLLHWIRLQAEQGKKKVRRNCWEPSLMKESPHLFFKLSKQEKGVRKVSISFNKNQMEAFSRTSSVDWVCSCQAGEECKGPPDIMDSRAIVTTMEKDTINFGGETNEIKIVALTPQDSKTSGNITCML